MCDKCRNRIASFDSEALASIRLHATEVHEVIGKVNNEVGNMLYELQSVVDGSDDPKLTQEEEMVRTMVIGAIVTGYQIHMIPHDVNLLEEANVVRMMSEALSFGVMLGHSVRCIQKEDGNRGIN